VKSVDITSTSASVSHPSDNFDKQTSPPPPAAAAAASAQ